ncbi:MAG: DUF4403 family protein [Chitinophagales bacterium]
MKNRPFSNIALIFTAIIWLTTACSCKSLEPTQPEAKYDDYEAPASIVNLPISISIKDIEKSINAQMTGLMYEDMSFEDNGNDNLMVKVWKKDAIKLRLQGNSIGYSVPLKLWLKKKIEIKQFGLNLSDVKEVEGAIQLNFVSDFQINPDWSIATKTNAEGYKWLETPSIKVVGYSLPVTFIADMLMEQNKEKIGGQIDAYVKDELNLKKYLTDVWGNMQEPMLVNDYYNLWLSIVPQQIMLTPFNNSLDSIRMKVGIKAVSEVTMGEKPQVKKDKNLPPLKMMAKIPDDFSVNIAASIPYKLAAEEAKRTLVGQTFTSGKRSVTVKDIDIWGRNKKLVIKAKVEGSIDGHVYMTGTPVYDAKKAVVTLDNLDFDLETKNVIQKTAAWLFNAKITKQMQPYLVFPLEQSIADMRSQVQEQLTNSKFDNGVSLTGKLNKMDIEEIFLTPTAIKVVVGSSGNLKVNFEGWEN